jgi:hypothetical protein
VFLDERKGNVIIANAEAGHWGHGDAVGELHAPDAEGSEKLGHCEGGGGGCCCLGWELYSWYGLRGNDYRIGESIEAQLKSKGLD